MIFWQLFAEAVDTKHVKNIISNHSPLFQGYFRFVQIIKCKYGNKTSKYIMDWPMDEVVEVPFISEDSQRK